MHLRNLDTLLRLRYTKSYHMSVFLHGYGCLVICLIIDMCILAEVFWYDAIIHEVNIKALMLAIAVKSKGCLNCYFSVGGTIIFTTCL